MGSPLPDVREIVLMLRASGGPYVWPRVWALAGASAERSAPEGLDRWLDTFPAGAMRRCGLSILADPNGGRQVVMAVAVEAPADLDPLPVSVHVGRWLTVTAHIHAPPISAQVAVLGPSGPPRDIPTALVGSRASASFSADRAGRWLVQVLADLGSGPRPLLEALVFAGVPPPTELIEPAAPGEDSSAAAGDPLVALEMMISRARATENLPPLRRDTRLDALADAHARHMRANRRIGHDLGAGDPRTRVARAGLAARSAGENVAHAADLRRAHRVLWASPSHRGNLLHPSFQALGLGIAPDEDGSVWVCELFASF
jgi:hypothetical protein